MTIFSSTHISEVHKQEVLEFQGLLTCRDEGTLSTGDSERILELFLDLLDDGVISISYPEEEGLVTK